MKSQCQDEEDEYDRLDFFFFFFNVTQYHDVSGIIWVQFFHDQCCILSCLFLNTSEVVGSSTETDNLQILTITC